MVYLATQKCCLFCKVHLETFLSPGAAAPTAVTAAAAPAKKEEKKEESEEEDDDMGFGLFD